MPSITLTASADVACWTNQSYGAGLGDHLPVGYWSTAVYRSAIRFTPPSWTAWTKITKATLNVYISDHNHIGVRSSTILVRRQNESSLWTKSAGTQDCESGFSGSNNTQNSDLSSSSTDQATFTSGTTANAKKSIVVTSAVSYYFTNKTSALVFTFAGNSSSDYTELWSREKGSTYDATLVIEYEVESVPNAPTLVAPASGASVAQTNPVFSWTHSDAQSNPQTAAEVALYDAAGTGLLYTWPVAGAAGSLAAPDALVRGTTYQYAVRTSDATGWGPFSAKRTFSIRALPTVTISTTRTMEFANGAPRLRVNWTSSQTQVKHRVQSGAFDSGWITGTTQTYLLSTVGLTNGTPVSVTVSVEAADALQGSDTESFTPRYGLTTHRKDLGSAPVNWETPSISATVPTGASLVIEYGSNDTAAPAPVAWYSTLSSVVKRRFLYWRAWLIPSATQGPTLDRITIPANFTIALVDHWTLDPNFSIDGSEYVYGTRSMSGESNGSLSGARSAAVNVRAGRSYILTGLMKAEGDPGCYFALADSSGDWVLSSTGAPIKSPTLSESRDWFTADELDVHRYRSPVWVAPSDMQVSVHLVVAGASGSKAWFDAIKVEESTVATPWTPGAVGASIVDAGGVQVDGSRGAFFRVRGRNGGLRDVVEGGTTGLMFGTDTELDSPSTGVLAINGVPIESVPAYVPPVVRVYAANGTWIKPPEIRYIVVECVGAGAAGGGVPATTSTQASAGGGGGGGGYARKLLTLNDLTSAGSLNVVVGIGGTGGTGAGGAGGDSYITGTGVASVSGGGGAGGAAGTATTGTTNSTGGDGGSAANGDVNAPGGEGGLGNTAGGSYTSQGYGGSSIFSGSQRGNGTDGGGAGGAGNTPGGGGSGAHAYQVTTAQSGGAGADGLVIITEYYS
jgi:hypothetical protein